jgi:hypothetical protein
VDDAIDIHHIFPQRWSASNGIEERYANSAVNKTAIDAHTNRQIGGNAPSEYLSTLEAKDKTSAGAAACTDRLQARHAVRRVRVSLA